MTDDSTAEKAWQEWNVVLLSREAPTYYETFMAGRASKPDVTALLRERAELREQLAEKSGALSEAVTALTLHKDRIESLSASLAEAQATIEKIAYELHRALPTSRRAAMVLADMALSAPSSTGGND